MRISNHINIGKILLFCLFLAYSGHLSGQPTAKSGITAELNSQSEYLDVINAQLLCSFGEPRMREFELRAGQPEELLLTGYESARASCQLQVFPPAGYTVRYFVQGGGAYQADRNGCQFGRISSGQDNSCRIEISQDPVTLMVYKKWIGASGQEDDIKVELECESGDYSGIRYINEGKPDGWEIRNIDPEGILCNVQETVRDTFQPDIIDCQGLLILPGKGEECTMINTKIVKRIEMLNRYGKIVMILLVLAVGLAAVRRMS